MSIDLNNFYYLDYYLRIRFYSGLRDINFTHTSCTSYFATVKYKAKLRTCDAPKIPYFNKNAILHESKYMKWTS